MILQKKKPADYFYLENVPGGYPLDVTHINLGCVIGPKLRKDLNFEGGSGIIIFQNGNYDLFFEKEPWFNAGRKIMEYMLENDKRLEEWEFRVKAWIDYLSSVNKEFSQMNFSSLSDEELFVKLEFIKDLMKKETIENAELVTNNYGTNFIQKEMEKAILELGFATHSVSPIILRATVDFPLLKYEDEIAKLALFIIEKKIFKIDKDILEKEIKDKIDKILEEYGWLDASINGNPKSVESITTDLNDLLSFKSEVYNIIQKRTQDKKEKSMERDELLKEILKDSNQMQKRQIMFCIKSAEYGRMCVDEVMQFLFNTRPIYNELGKRLEIDEVELKFMHMDEIRDCLLNKKEVPKKDIMERQKLCLCLVGENKVEIYSGKEAQKWKDELASIVHDKDAPLKGEIAFSKGKVKGIARLVKDVKDMSKVNKGEILVSSRTYPDLLPAMKKASAIVAELGGLLSHAAIVSRELGIPCLVGVRNATSKIKDGDIIEIDTEKGVITILNNGK